MNIEQLQYVCAVAKTQSITMAAETLFVTQQTVSKAINKLETELGKTLLNRSYKGVTLTDAGKVFVERAQQIVEQFQVLQEVMNRENPCVQPEGAMTILGSPYIVNTIISDLLVNYYRLYPKVNISVEEQLASEILDYVSNHDEGVGLIGIVNDSTGAGKIQSYSDTLDWEALYADDLLAFVSEKHPLANRQMVTFRELTAYPLVMGDCPGFECILSEDYGLKARVVVNSPNAALHTKVVSEGMAVGFSTSMINQSLTAFNQFVSLQIKEQPKLYIIVVKSKGYQPNSLQVTLLEEIKRILKKI